jgi:hypothetical protein
MKSTVILSFALILWIIGCQNQSTEISNSSEQVSFSTNSSSYVESDTIKLSLRNNASYDITVGLRCGLYLEMFYQKQVNQDWSDTLWFSYMSLRCLTDLDTVLMKHSFAHSMPAQIFNSTGTFRLLIDVHIPQRDTSLMVISNQFQIQ